MVNKRKSSPALFELISKSKMQGEEQTAVPPWMVPKPAGAAEQAKLAQQPKVAPQPESAQPQAPADQAAETPGTYAPIHMPVEMPAEVASRKDIAPAGGEAIISTAGGRLRLSLNYTNCVIAGVAAVLVLAVVFMLGRAAAPSAPAGQASAGGTPPQPSARGGPEAPAAGKAGEIENAAGSVKELEKGKYYLIIQGLIGNSDEFKKDAQAIVDFLNNKMHEPAKYFTSKDGKYLYVVSTTAFDSPESDKARQFVQSIEKVGRLYRNQGGRYDFRQREGGWWYKHQ